MATAQMEANATYENGVDIPFKLTGAALAASALGLFASRGANAQSVGLASERGAAAARVVTSAGATGVECVAARVEGASRRAAARMGALVAAEARAATTGGADSGRSRREG